MATKDEETVVYEKEWKVPSFTGTNIPYSNWERDAKKAIKAFKPERALRLLLRSLLDVAKAEAELREDTVGDFADTDEVFAYLKKLFGDKRSKSKKLAQFHDRIQSETEDIMTFSQDLVQLSIGLADRPVKLKDQFAENVYSTSLRWELKKKMKENSTIDFQDLRDLALEWEDLNDKPTATPKKKKVVVDSAEVVVEPPSLTTLVEKQSAVLDKICDRLEKLEQPSCGWCDSRGHIMGQCYRFKRELPHIREHGWDSQGGRYRGRGGGRWSRGGRGRGRGNIDQEPERHWRDEPRPSPAAPGRNVEAETFQFQPDAQFDQRPSSGNGPGPRS